MNAPSRVLPATRAVLAGVALAALAAGCASTPPPRLYLLTGATRPAAATAADAERGPTLGVGPVTLPRYLERLHIVTRRGAEIEVAEFERWGEPLSESVPRALAAHLGVLLQTERVIVFPWARTRVPDHQVVVDVIRFDGTLGGEAQLEARWRVLGQEGKELALRYSTVREATGEPGYPSLVAAMNRSLGALSREIAEAVKELRARRARGGAAA